MPYANNKGADQPAHPRSLISAFVVRCLDSIITIFAKSRKGSSDKVYIVPSCPRPSFLNSLKFALSAPTPFFTLLHWIQFRSNFKEMQRYFSKA